MNQAKPVRLCMCIFLCVFLLTITFPVKAQMAKVEERRLVFIGEGTPPELIKIKVGEVLQIQSFKLPVAGAFQDATLKIQLEGDISLQFLGQVRLSAVGEGQSGLNAFFLAIKPGTSKAKVTVLNDQHERITGLESDYSIRVTATNR